MLSSQITSTFKVAIEKVTITTNRNQTDKRKLEGVGSHYEGKENVPVFRLPDKIRPKKKETKFKLFHRHTSSNPPAVIIRKFLPEGHYFIAFEHVVVPMTPSEVTKDVQQKICIMPGFHYRANATTTTQNQSDYKVEQPSFMLIALF